MGARKKEQPYDSYLWEELDDDAGDRWDELYETDDAWSWISELLAGPLGLTKLSEEEERIENERYQKELSTRGVAKAIED